MCLAEQSAGISVPAPERITIIMTDLLIKIFIREDKKGSSNLRARYGALSGAVGIITNLINAAVKLIVGFTGSGVSVLADAANNLSDAGSSLVTFVGFRLSAKPPDKTHPYGHARIEYITGLIVSFMIVALGGFFLIESVGKISSGEGSDYSVVALVFLGLTVLIKLWQAFFYKKIALKINSAALHASFFDSISDVAATSVVLVCAIISKLSPLDIDGYAGAAVALFIIVNGFRLIVSTASPLLGEPPDKNLAEKIKALVMSVDGVIGIHDMIIHSYGADKIFCTLHAEVPSTQNILLSHDIIDDIERRAASELNVNLVIHMDPVMPPDERSEKIRKAVEEILSGISKEIRYHDLRAVFGADRTTVSFDVVIPSDFAQSDEDVRSDISKKLTKLFPEAVPVITVDRDFSDIADI